MKTTPLAVSLAGLACTVLCGCPGSALDSNYKGEPIARIKGQMILGEGVAAPEEVRLALVWYTSWLEPTKPDSVVTQDVVYKGSFPANFTFELYGPPPASALVPREDGLGHEAHGILMAYVDTNKSGKLDPFDPFEDGGVMNDTILGATTSLFDLSKPAYWVSYTDAEPPTQGWPAGSKKGFNLEASSVVNDRYVSVRREIDSPITLELTGERELAALICQANFADGFVSPNPIEPCRIAATPNVLRVMGGVTRTYRDVAGVETVNDYAFVSLSDGARYIDDATVTVNGVVAEASGEGAYRIDHVASSSRALIVVDAPGFARRDYDVRMPSGHLVTPAVGATARSGEPWIIEWAGTTVLDYRLVYATDGNGEFIGDPFTRTETSATTKPISYNGKVSLKYIEYGPSFSDRFGSYVNGDLHQVREVNVLP